MYPSMRTHKQLSHGLHLTKQDASHTMESPLSKKLMVHQNLCMKKRVCPKRLPIAVQMNLVYEIVFVQKSSF